MGSLMFSSVGAKLWVTQVEHCRVSKQESKCNSVLYQGHSAFEAVCIYIYDHIARYDVYSWISEDVLSSYTGKC